MRVRRLFLVVAALAATASLSVALSHAAGSGSAKRPCRLPSSTPLWIDFGHGGTVPFWKLFARPGLVAAASNFFYPPQIRARGGSVVYIDLRFHNEIGSLTDPPDPSEIPDIANQLYDYAAASLQCTHPWIALDELFGARNATPWPANVARYRADVLEYLRVLAHRGAHPFLLVNSIPFTDGAAGDWWRQVAKVSDIVREVYFPAPRIWKQGPYVGSRTVRSAFRRGVSDFTSIGIPASRMGIVLGFQTGRGGGREGLKPAYRWFDTVKWQALAARQVAKETGLSTIWSWGWGLRKRAPHPRLDALDKAKAACVYLWTRKQSLCDGPRAAGRAFNPSLTQGQINLPRGVRCTVGSRKVLTSAIPKLARVTRDRQIAFTALYERAVTRPLSSVSASDVLRAERWVVETNFHGSTAAYHAALRKAHATVGEARDVLADEIVRLHVEQKLHVLAPTQGQVSAFYSNYADQLARSVRTKPAVPWLGASRGIAIEGFAPDRVFKFPRHRWSVVPSPFKTYLVQATGPSIALGATQLGKAAPAIRTALKWIERDDAWRGKVANLESRGLRRTACRRDQLPALDAVELTNYLPFLRLTA
jgi:hypothetical protein